MGRKKRRRPGGAVEQQGEAFRPPVQILHRCPDGIALEQGEMNFHFVDAFKIGKADAALAASVFHFGEIAILDLKNELHMNQIPVRI